MGKHDKVGTDTQPATPDSQFEIMAIGGSRGHITTMIKSAQRNRLSGGCLPRSQRLSGMDAELSIINRAHSLSDYTPLQGVCRTCPIIEKNSEAFWSRAAPDAPTLRVLSCPCMETSWACGGGEARGIGRFVPSRCSGLNSCSVARWATSRFACVRHEPQLVTPRLDSRPWRLVWVAPDVL